MKVMKRLIGELDEVCKGDDDKDQACACWCNPLQEQLLRSSEFWIQCAPGCQLNGYCGAENQHSPGFGKSEVVYSLDEPAKAGAGEV